MSEYASGVQQFALQGPSIVGATLEIGIDNVVGGEGERNVSIPLRHFFHGWNPSVLVPRLRRPRLLNVLKLSDALL